MEQYIKYGLEVIKVEVVKLQTLLDDSHLLSEQIEVIRLDIHRLNQAIIDIREKFNTHSDKNEQ